MNRQNPRQEVKIEGALLLAGLAHLKGHPEVKEAVDDEHQRDVAILPWQQLHSGHVRPSLRYNLRSSLDLPNLK